MRKIILLQTDVGYYGDVLSTPDLPLGLLTAAQFLHQDYKIVIIDARLTRGWKELLRKEINLGNVVCVGITAMLGNSIRQGLEMSAYVKDLAPSIPVIWGGKNPTLSADKTINQKNIDIVVRGDGEKVFNELARALDKGASFKDIKGISFKDGQRIVHNSLPELVEINRLPRLPYDLVDVRRYRPKMGGKRSLNYETSRGCPVGCPFCYNNLTGREIWRALSPERVIEDLGFLKKTYDIEHFYFVDDNLFCDIGRLKVIASGFILKDYRITWDTQGACLEDICALSDDELKLFKKSGLKRLAIGIQTGSDKIRKLLGSHLTNEKCFSVNRKLKKYSIKPHYYFMVAFPGETDEDRRATVSLALKLLEENREATTSSFFCFAPWPGTELFELAHSKYGLEEPQDISYWMKEWDFSQVPWLTETEKSWLHNLFLASMFYDRKAEWFSDSLPVKLISAAYRPLAMFRIKHGLLNFMFEAKIINLGKKVLKYL